MYNIFEKPWTLLIVAVVVLLFIYIIRAFKPEKRQWWPLFIPIMIAISAFATDIFVETDLENINSIIKSCIQASRNEDADTIDTFIASDYHDSQHLSKQAIMIFCRAIFSEPAVERFVKLNQSIDLSSPNATVLIKGFLFFEKESRFYKELKPAMAVKLELGLKKYSNKKWIINRVELLEIDNQSFDWNTLKSESGQI
ncbi:MAG: hypothetical protein H8D56_07420 [Planctomycetes bacterium]|nr:hypothetical protein [Planctomycetota bacterium]MBL7146162.1 hypothetical protein [Phycisphaerae bacterium]